MCPCSILIYGLLVQFPVDSFLMLLWSGLQGWEMQHWATVEISTIGLSWIFTSMYTFFFQLSFLRGEKILILRQTTADWWWGERAGCCGYIPANHLGKQLEECDLEDTWQDEEYFGSYGTLVQLGSGGFFSLIVGSDFKNLISELLLIVESCLLLQAMWSLLQLLSSALVAWKQP